jgi:hypothetical protein
MLAGPVFPAISYQIFSSEWIGMDWAQKKGRETNVASTPNKGSRTWGFLVGFLMLASKKPVAQETLRN